MYDPDKGDGRNSRLVVYDSLWVVFGVSDMVVGIINLEQHARQDQVARVARATFVKVRNSASYLKKGVGLISKMFFEMYLIYRKSSHKRPCHIIRPCPIKRPPLLV